MHNAYMLRFQIYMMLVGQSLENPETVSKDSDSRDSEVRKKKKTCEKFNGTLTLLFITKHIFLSKHNT